MQPLRLLLILLALALTACRGGPPSDVAAGPRSHHPSLGLSIVVPEGWQLSSPRDGFALVRSTPYGGGYPTFNVRIVGADDLPSLRFVGKVRDGGPGRTEYRYEKWGNARGRGYRMEALIDADGTWLFVDASVWDPAMRRDDAFFREVFWPLLNSLSVGPR